MTDFTKQNFKFWTKHPSLQKFIQRGILDFAIYNANEDTELYLTISKVRYTNLNEMF